MLLLITNTATLGFEGCRIQKQLLLLLIKFKKATNEAPELYSKTTFVTVNLCPIFIGDRRSRIQKQLLLLLIIYYRTNRYIQNIIQKQLLLLLIVTKYLAKNPPAWIQKQLLLLLIIIKPMIEPLVCNIFKNNFCYC